MELNVVTLNCWGLPFGGSKHKKERMKHIAKELSSGVYDIVALQEIWVLEDYQLIKSTVEAVLPHSFYFRMGMMNGGLCMFSKWPIIDTFYHPYSLNGYAHKVTMGDWYISKMVALCKIDVNGMIVNVYNTHAHALYAPSNIPEKDEFLIHRLTQLYELSEFVRLTSGSADLVLVMGDFNSEPFSIATKLAIANASLWDAWETRGNKEDIPRQTVEWCGNEYTSTNTRCYAHSDGERIDYITYRPSPTLRVTCNESRCVRNREKGPSFSDHEAVMASLTLDRRDFQGEGDPSQEDPCNNNPNDDQSPWQHLPDHLKEAIVLVTNNITKVKSDQKLTLLKALFCLFLLLLSLSLGNVNQVLVFVWTCGMTLLTAFFFSVGVIVKECEKKTLTGIVEGMKVRLSMVEKKMRGNGDVRERTTQSI